MLKNVQQILSDPSERYQSAYRWAMLTIATLTTMLVVAMPAISLSVLFDQIQQTLAISLIQVGLIWSIASFTGLVMAVPTGILSDRFGTRQMIIIGVIGSGVLGLSRGFATTFVTFVIANILHGLISATIVLNLIKLISIWFAPEQRGTALGILSSGFAFGFLSGSYISASYLSPLMGGWANVFIFFGIIAILLGIIWSSVHPGDPVQPQSSEPFSPGAIAASIQNDMRILLLLPQVWFLGIAKLLFWGAVRGFSGYLPLYLRGEGWEATAADGTLSLFFLFSLLGAIPLSAWSDRVGARKPFLIVASIVMGCAVIGIGLFNGWTVVVVVACGGLIFDMYMGLSTGMVTEFHRVPPRLAGLAVGLIVMFTEIGGVMAPIIGNSLEQISPHTPFYFWGSLALASVAGIMVMREDGFTQS